MYNMPPSFPNAFLNSRMLFPPTWAHPLFPLLRGIFLVLSAIDREENDQLNNVSRTFGALADDLGFIPVIYIV